MTNLPPVPHRVPMIDLNGYLTPTWSDWFQKVFVRAGGTVAYTNDELAEDQFTTFARLQNISSDRLVGRDTAGTGSAEQVSVGGGIEFSGSGGIQTSALTGDVTKAAGGTATTIANGSVNFAKLLSSDWVSSNAASGYVKIGSGIYLQWGQTAAITTGASLTVSFPVVFPTACRQVIAGIQGTGFSTVATGQWSTTSYTTSSFSLYNGCSITQGFNYIAVGY